jgi:hypothetical protein
MTTCVLGAVKCYVVAGSAGSSFLQTSGKHRMLRHQQLQQEDHDSRRASSRGIIPKAKVKTVKMTFVIVFGKFSIDSIYPFVVLYHTVWITLVNALKLPMSCITTS